MRCVLCTVYCAVGLCRILLTVAKRTPHFFLVSFSSSQKLTTRTEEAEGGLRARAAEADTLCITYDATVQELSSKLRQWQEWARQREEERDEAVMGRQKATDLMEEQRGQWETEVLLLERRLEEKEETARRHETALQRADAGRDEALEAIRGELGEAKEQCAMSDTRNALLQKEVARMGDAFAEETKRQEEALQRSVSDASAAAAEAARGVEKEMESMKRTWGNVLNGLLGGVQNSSSYIAHSVVRPLST